MGETIKVNFRNQLVLPSSGVVLRWRKVADSLPETLPIDNIT
jgi:hypothetical protein